MIFFFVSLAGLHLHSVQYINLIKLGIEPVSFH